MNVQSEAGFWGETHKLVTEQLIARDRASFVDALGVRAAIAWLRSRASVADVESFGLHRFAVIAVIATLRQLSDDDPRVSTLYNEWDRARDLAADTLRVAARR
jgi:hypothetical protein